MPLTRDQIRGTARRLLSVAVPEWGGDVLLRRLSARARMLLNHDFAGQELIGETALRYLARLVTETAIDEHGDPLFAADEVEELLADDWSILDRIAAAAIKHNKLNAEIVQDAKKNSSETPSTDY